MNNQSDPAAARSGPAPGCRGRSGARRARTIGVCKLEHGGSIKVRGGWCLLDRRSSVPSADRPRATRRARLQRALQCGNAGSPNDRPAPAPNERGCTAARPAGAQAVGSWQGVCRPSDERAAMHRRPPSGTAGGPLAPKPRPSSTGQVAVPLDSTHAGPSLVRGAPKH